MQPFKLYKLFAIGEALTWSLLITGLLIRALFGVPPVVLTIVGGIHGAVFLGYGVSAALVGVNQRWSFGRIVAAISLAIVPYATVPFEKSVEKKGMLVGDWRTEKSTDPRDNNWFDSLFRWFINRPALLVIVLLAVVVGIFSGLLFLGPPDTWGPR
jgi:integral membrane protein